MFLCLCKWVLLPHPLTLDKSDDLVLFFLLVSLFRRKLRTFVLGVCVCVFFFFGGGARLPAKNVSAPAKTQAPSPPLEKYLRPCYTAIQFESMIVISRSNELISVKTPRYYVNEFHYPKSCSVYYLLLGWHYVFKSERKCKIAGVC